MDYVIVRFKNINLLINDGLSLEPLIEHMNAIETLNTRVLSFHRNALTASAEQGRALEQEARALISKIGYNIIGVPFTSHDAELYALDRGLTYTILELNSHGTSR